VLGLLASILIPTDFDMRARGTLQPVVKREIFAPSQGEIETVLKDNGQDVQAGEVLIVMRNPELEIKRSQIEGEWKAAIEDASATYQQLHGSRQSLTEAERVQAQGRYASAKQRIKSLDEQLKLIDERRDKLTIKSPIAGRVMTWDAKKLLQNRPVETGQVLMTIAAAGTDHEVELYMPERRVEHMQRARDKAQKKNPQADLDVDFIVMTDPGVSHSGKVIQVNPTAEPHDEHGNMVRVRVKPDKPLTSPRPGATVTANVHCGRASFLWAKLHEAWEWVEANVLF
jgi:multidrug efflux pump subunit AcrA (membrane-fusion protein)